MNRYWVTTAAAALFLSAHHAVAGDADLVDAMLTSTSTSCDDLGIERGRALEVLQALKAEILDQLRRGESVQLDGFGTFFMERPVAAIAATSEGRAPSRSVVRFQAQNAASRSAEEPPRVAQVGGTP